MKEKIKLSAEFFNNNRKKFTSLLNPSGIAIFNPNDVYYRNGDQPYRFRQQSDLFYLTGIEQENSVLLLFPDCPNPDLRELLFITEPTESMEIWEGKKLTREETKRISGISGIKWLEQFDATLAEVMSYAENIYLNANEYPKFQSDVPYRDLRFGRQIREKFPNHNYCRAAPLVTQLRMVKQDEEIRMIREAIGLTGKAFRRMLKFVEPGVMEYQVEAEMTHEFLFVGASGSAYKPIIASGKNACILHYTENKSECENGDMLLMDFGAEYGYYASDISRTIPVNGKFSRRQRACYDAVLRVLRNAPLLLLPGKTIDQINKEVNRLMEKEMIGLNLFTKTDVEKQDPEKPLFTRYFMHGVSHYLGLDVHDVGTKFEPLQPGMVLTFEPGLYIREENLGIRLENNFLITDNKPLDLSEEIPVEAEEIEIMMRLR